jgi:hypothetical protein
MATTDPPDHSRLTEMDIHAYADGVLPEERTERLRRYLERRTDEARRVAFYSSLNARFKRTFQPNDSPDLARMISKRSRIRSARRIAQRVFIVMTVALAASSGWIVASQPSDEVLSDAAVMVLARASASDRNAAPPTYASGDDKASPDFTPAGLRLTEKRTVALGPISRISEFVYLNTEGKPVVLVVGLALATSEQPQWVARRVGNLRLLTWVTRHRRYVLAGNADTRGLMRAADMTTLR